MWYDVCKGALFRLVIQLYGGEGLAEGHHTARLDAAIAQVERP